jgi:LytS/YehU family sensor histidine kinase
MVLHTYVENAVKHGFRNTTSGGLLEIIIEPVLRGVLLIILDNGKNTADQPGNSAESTGKGINIMESYYRLFEKQYGCKIQTTYTDKSKLNNGTTGFEVKIRIEF